MEQSAYTEQIQQHVDKGNYHAAINIALSAMNEGRRNDDQVCVDKFLGVIQEITHKLVQEFGSGNNPDRS